MQRRCDSSFQSAPVARRRLRREVLLRGRCRSLWLLGGALVERMRSPALVVTALGATCALPRWLGRHWARPVQFGEQDILTSGIVDPLRSSGWPASAPRLTPGTGAHHAPRSRRTGAPGSAAHPAYGGTLRDLGGVEACSHRDGSEVRCRHSGRELSEWLFRRGLSSLMAAQP
jgi:hypothetical protein